VGLVDDEEPGGAHEAGELLGPEAGVDEALGGDEEDVDCAVIQQPLDVPPLGDIRGVDGGGADSGTFCGGDLVPHEGEQGGDDQGGPGAGPALQERGDEVHRGLPPPGALHHERPPVVCDQRLDGLELPGVELGRRVAGEGAEDGEGLIAQPGSVALHGPGGRGGVGRRGQLGRRSRGRRRVPRPSARRGGVPWVAGDVVIIRVGGQLLRVRRGLLIPGRPARGHGPHTLTRG